MRASWRSSSLKAVSITRCATFMLAQALPQRRVGAGVAGEDPPAGRAAIDREADRRHGVRGAQHLDALAAELQRRRRPRTARARAPGCSALGRRVKSGQIDAVEDVLAQRVERRGQRMHLDRRRGPRPAARITLSASSPIASTWSRCEWLTRMWSMRASSSSVQVADAGAGVDQHVVVEQERRWSGSRRRWSRSSRAR